MEKLRAIAQHQLTVHPPGLPGDAAQEIVNTFLDRLYENQQPKHFGTRLPYSLGGPDPLNGISVYWRAQPVPHWHFISYGFSELYAKESSDLEMSGYGFELTFRLACADTQNTTTPPVWPLNFLQNLARYVFKSGNVFDDGHWMTANGPIALECDTKICSMGFVMDPELPPIDTPNGNVKFLQVVGLTLDEENSAKHWQTKQLLNIFLPYMPLWITDLGRDSMLSNPIVAAQVSEGTNRDGSSHGFLYTDVLLVEERPRLLRKPLIQVTLGARQVEALIELLPLRLPYGRPCSVAGPHWRLSFDLAEQDSMETTDRVLTLKMTAATMQDFVSGMRAREGLYTLPGLKPLLVKVQKTIIKDTKGNIVTTFG